MKIVAHDKTSVTVGGFGSLDIVGWHGETMIATDPVLGPTAALDLGRKPSIRLLAREFMRTCATARDGRVVAVLGLQKKARYVRVFSKSLATNDAIDLQPTKNVEFACAGFIADRVIALPGDLGVHRRYHERRHAQQPHLQDGKRLVPLDGGTGGDAHDLTGVIASGERDFIVWGGRVFALRDGALVRAVPFDLARNFNNFGLSCVAADSGFFTISSQRLVHVIPGARAAKPHLPRSYFRIVRPGPAGKLLLEAAHDTAEKSALWLYDPSRRVATPIPTPIGTYAYTAFYCRARKAIGALASTNDGTVGRRFIFAAI